MTKSLETILEAWNTGALGGAELTARSDAELAAALDAAAAAGGGIVRLDPAKGPYDLFVRGHRGADGPLVITSLDPANPATLRRLTIDKSEMVAVADVKLDGGPSDGKREASVSSSKDVVLVGIEATGRADGFLAEGGEAKKADGALLVRDSEDVTVADSSFHGFNQVLGAINTDGLKIVRNDVSGAQGDGFRGGGLQDALFEGNHFHDFYGSTQTLNHSDMLQLWSSNVEQINARVVIRDNVFDAGEMAASQSIFIGHEAYGRPERGPSAAYEDITIEGNVIYNGARNGIVVAHTNDAVIRDNTVLWSKDASTKSSATSKAGNDVPWIIASKMPGLVMEGNITPGLRVDGGSFDALLRSKNVLLDFLDASSPTYAYDHFVNLGGAGGGARDLELRPDSPYFGAVGAPMSSPTGQEGVKALLSQSPIAGAPMGVSLTAELSRIDGAPAGNGTGFLWRLDDGRTFTGPSLDWVFETPGRHEVVLEVTAPDGRTDVVTRAFDIAAPELVAFDFSKGVKDLSGYGAAFSVQGSNVLGSGAFLLRPDTGIALDREEAQLANLSALEIAIGFAKGSAGGAGAIVGQHGRVAGTILGDGSIRFQLDTTEGQFDVRTAPGLVLDTKAHDLVLGFDGGRMTIALDGALVAEGPASGILAPNGGHTLMLGKAWETNLTAKIDSFVVRLPTSTDADAIREAALLSGQGTVTKPKAEDAPAAPAPAEQDAPGDPAVDLPMDDVLEAEPDDGPVDPAPTPAPAPADPVAGGGAMLKEVDFDGAISEGIRLVDPAGAGAAGVEGRDGAGFALDGSSKVIVSDRADVLQGLDAFEMSAALSKDAADGTGTVLSIYTGMSLKVRSDGSLKFWIKTDADDYSIRSKAGLLSTTDWHEVGVRFDGDAGAMAILLDGKVVASGAASGAMPERMAQHLMVGHAWGGSIEGRVDDVVLRAGADQFAFAAQPGGGGAADAAAFALAEDDDADLQADAFGFELGDAATSVVDLGDALLAG